MSRRIIAATLLLAFALASCQTWTPLDGVPDPVPDEIRVELLTGEQLKVRGGRIEADTLVGRRLGGVERIRVPVDQIAAVEAGGTSGPRTALLFVGGGLLVFVIVGIATCCDLGA